MVKWNSDWFGDGWYLLYQFLTLTMYEFERNLYMYYFNCIKPPPKIDMKLNPVSSDPVQVNNFLNNDFGINSKSQHNQFKCCFACQDPRNTILTRNVYPNWKLYPLPKQILSVYHFLCLLDFSFLLMSKILVLKVYTWIRWEYSTRTRGAAFK